MSGFNLPPGCSESDIPGNSPEDVSWEKLLGEIGQTPITAEEARRRWESQPDLMAVCNNIAGELEVWLSTDDPRPALWAKSRIKRLRAAVLRAQKVR